MEITRGLVVRSAAGHDKGDFFVILSLDDKYAFICDGKSRKLEKTKKKKHKHLFVTNTVLPEDSLKTNREIRRALSAFNKNA